MKITMYVAGLPFNGDTLKNRSLGGSETAGYYIAKGLVAQGHSVFCFTTIKPEEAGTFEGVNYLPIGERNDNYPLGYNFMAYATTVPCDVLIGQRVPGMFFFRYASKLNLWWTHDLALKRMHGNVSSQLWNLDKALCVSDFHVKQIQSVYDFHDRICGVLRNGIDLDLFHPAKPEKKLESKAMLYTSRPERGLIHLVKENGIMERLLKVDPEIKLIVCGYENTRPETEAAYNQIWDRCKVLPNVQNFGALTKENLYKLMSNAWLHIYPTEFEEVSCITAMEEQASGTPFLTSKIGALSETLEDGGVIWADDSEQGFVESVTYLKENPARWKELNKKCLKKAEEYDYKLSVESLEQTIEACFQLKTSSKNRMVKHLINHSDIIAATKIQGDLLDDNSQFLRKKFGKILNGDYAEFYEDVAHYNTVEIKNNHSLGNDQLHLSMPRMGKIIEALSKLPDDSLVLDYGCCIGQFTIAAARAFPHLKFCAVDIVKDQIEIGIKYAEENKIKNIKFVRASSPSELKGFEFDFVYAAEVLEHVLDPNKILDELEELGRDKAEIMLTSPSGAHEQVRWDLQTKREHIHHFEDQDLLDMLGHKKDFQCNFIKSPTVHKFGEVLGNYVYSWIKTKGIEKSKPIDYDRKLKIQNPQQTLAVCIICKGDSHTLGATLETIAEIANEIIIGFDGKGRAWNAADEFEAQSFLIDSPMQIGFDAARNETIKRSSSDWILWIDDDETMQWPERLPKFLRDNQYDSYAIHQHHFSAEPAGLLKTDLPCRLFRADKKIQFFGVVHEHPETGINEGAGKTFLMPPNEVSICHNGYDTEDTRKRRFERNIGLMFQDRKKYPERHLGKFLWIRDLCHMNRFEAMQGIPVNQTMVDRAKEALDYWRKLIESNQVRMMNDALPYVTESVNLLTQNNGIEFELGLGINHGGIGDKLNGSAAPTQRAKFLNHDDVRLYANTMLEDKINSVTGDYL